MLILNKCGLYSILICITCFLLILLTSCEDIFETDIENKYVTINSPYDSLITTQNIIHFWWQEVEGASAYNLLVVNPDFRNIDHLVLDTNILNNTFEYSFDPGEYQWRVKAYNSAYETLNDNIYTFSIDTTRDISQLQIMLSSPADEYATNKSSVSFSWYKIAAADYYDFKIRSGNWNSGFSVIDTSLTDLDSVSYTFTANASYFWGVSARNPVSATNFTYRLIIYDTVQPAQPTLNNISATDTLFLTTDSSYTFSWNFITDSGSDIIVDNIRLYSLSESLYIVDTITNQVSYEYTFSDSGLFLFDARSCDKAGNWGEFCQAANIRVE